MSFFSRFFKKTPALIPNYSELWDTCIVNSNYSSEIILTKARIIDNHIRYKEVSQATGVPWELIAAIHYREASFNFKTCLHNGDPLPGPTYHVPKGRGPFKTWEEAAIDALKMEEMPEFWTDERMLQFAERYNGLGYRAKGIYSPYVWAGTNHYKSGMYTADSRFDSGKTDHRLGVACIVKSLR